MLKFKKYSSETLTEEAWFDSSMIVYTKMIEDANDNVGELYITYKGGNTYVYHNVSLADYVLFIGGGTDGSHGKTINKIIKGQYKFEKLEPLNCDELNMRYEALLEEERKMEEVENEDLKVWNQIKFEINDIKEYMDEVSDYSVTRNKVEELLELLYEKFGREDVF